MMKIQFVYLAVAIGLFVASPAIVSAQVEKESQQGLANVLRLSGINDEIKLAEQQQEKLFGLWLEIKFDLERAFGNYQDNFSETLPAPRQAELKKELAEAIVRIREKEAERLEEALTAEQLSRLKQLRIQYLTRNSDGVGALQEELDLTPSQIRKINSVSEAMKKELKQIQANQRTEQLTKIELVAIFKEMQEKSKKEIMAALTTSQQQKLKSLRGEEFDFAKGRLVSAEPDVDEESDEVEKSGDNEKSNQGK
jgi:hypothetical protein